MRYTASECTSRVLEAATPPLTRPGSFSTSTTILVARATVASCATAGAVAAAGAAGASAVVATAAGASLGVVVEAGQLLPLPSLRLAFAADEPAREHPWIQSGTIVAGYAARGGNTVLLQKDRTAKNAWTITGGRGP